MVRGVIDDVEHRVAEREGEMLTEGVPSDYRCLQGVISLAIEECEEFRVDLGPSSYKFGPSWTLVYALNRRFAVSLPPT